MLNKQKGNMYGWVTHTWNPIKGKCPHDCSYCYMKVFPQGELRFDEKCMRDDLGSNNYIFVGSSTDMFARCIPDKWIDNVLNRCYFYDKNSYLFQSKNPNRFRDLLFPDNVILGATIETNRLNENISNAPDQDERKEVMSILPHYNKMVSIEPIMDFDLDIFVYWIKAIKPKFVSIGADSKGHNLPEPSWDKIQTLIRELRKFTEIKVKDNLKRLEVSGNSSHK